MLFIMTTKKKKTKTETNKNSNVNKNNINITINHPKKRTYKKRSSTNKQGIASTVFSPTIINQIPSQNIQPPENLNKYAYDYNVPSNPKPNPISIPISNTPIILENSIKQPIKTPSIKASSIKVPSIKSSSKNTFNTPYADAYSSLSDSNSAYYSVKPETVSKYAFYDTFSDQVPLAYPDFTSESEASTNIYQNLQLQKAFNKLKENKSNKQEDIAQDAYTKSQMNSAFEKLKNYKKEDENKGNEYFVKTQLKTGFDKLKTYRNDDFGISPSQVHQSYTFEDQTITTTPDRRETILPGFQPADLSFNETPNLMERAKTRRKKKEMIEARTMENEDKNYFYPRIRKRASKTTAAATKDKVFTTPKRIRKSYEELMKDLQKTRDKIDKVQRYANTPS